MAEIEIEDIRSVTETTISKANADSKQEIDRNTTKRYKKLIECLARSTKHIKHIHHNIFKRKRTATLKTDYAAKVEEVADKWEAVEKTKVERRNTLMIKERQLEALQQATEQLKKAIEEEIDAAAELQAEVAFQKWKEHYDKEHHIS